MALQFVLGGSGSGKSRDTYQRIITDSLEHPEQRYIILVPEQFSLQTQKTLVSMHPRKGLLNIDILSFNRLAYRVFAETGARSGRCWKRRERRWCSRKSRRNRRRI